MNIIQKPVLTENNYWLITRYDDVKLLLDEEYSSKKYLEWLSTDPDKLPKGWFNSNSYLSEMARVSGGLGRAGFPVEDNPERTKSILPFMSLVSKEKISKLAEDIQFLVDNIISSNIDNNDFDFVRDLLRPVGTTFISNSLDVVEVYQQKEELYNILEFFYHHSTQLEWITTTSDEDKEQFLKYRDWISNFFFMSFIARSEGNPDDFFTKTIHSFDGDLFQTGTNITHFMTVQYGIVPILSSILLTLHKDKSFQNKLRTIKEFTPQVVDEILRYSIDIPLFARVLKQDVKIDGVLLEAGMMLAIDYRSANHDPDVYPNPNELDFEHSIPTLTFGHGSHACLGRVTSRTLIPIVLKGILNNTSEIVSNGEPVIRIRGTEVASSLPFILKG